MQRNAMSFRTPKAIEISRREQKERRVNLASTNNPKGGLSRGVAVSTACVIICRKPATQAQSRQ